MTTTDIAAWWGAVVATAVLSWDVWKWVRSGARLRVVSLTNVVYPDGRRIGTRRIEGDAVVNHLATYCQIEIRNTGDRPTTIISVFCTHRADELDAHIIYSVSQLTAHHGAPLPALLGPGEIWRGAIEMEALDELLKRGPPLVRIRASHLSKDLEVPIGIDHVQTTTTFRSR